MSRFTIQSRWRTLESEICNGDRGENRMFFHPLKERHFFSSLIILVIFVFYPAVLFADAGRVFRDNNKAVVVIVTYDSQGKAIGLGSGFIVKADGAVATNYHVI